MTVEINDERKITEFKNITFSGYKKTEARKELLKNIISNRIEPVCFWVGEFVCAGHFLYLWEIVFLFIGKNIHIGNPKLPIYIELKLDEFADIINKFEGRELRLRNNPKVRKIFAEVFIILAQSKKKNSFDCPKISHNEFNIQNIGYRLEADNLNQSKKYFSSKDPKELLLCINEFIWHIKKKNTTDAIYWLEWLMTYETVCKKSKKILTCDKRKFPVEFKYRTESIWIIWDILLGISDKNPGLNKIINGILRLFCVRYSTGIKRKRRFLIYFAISLITEKIDGSIKIVAKENILNNALKNLDVIYKQIKKNENKTKNSFLFGMGLYDNNEKNDMQTNNNRSANNLENTTNKLSIMSDMFKIN